LTGKSFLHLLLVVAFVAIQMVRPAQAQEAIDLSKLNNPVLIVAGQRFIVTQPPLEIKQGKLVFPLRPIAQRLLADLRIDNAQQVINIVRADDRAVLTFDGKTGTLSVLGTAPQDIPDSNLVDFTPQRESIPQSLLERFFNVFVGVDTSKNEVSVVPNSPAFLSALESYQDQLATQPAQRRQLPQFRLNALQYNSAINQNNITFLGQTTTGRFSSQIGRTVINGYGTYLGSTFGPGWRYSQGGIDIIRPRVGELQIGDFTLRTGSLFANGFNRGVILEKVFGAGTKIGIEGGALQVSTQRVGIQVQRPLFQRQNGLLYATVDTSDFNLKSSFWRNHQLYSGIGFGGFADRNNDTNHARGYLTYFFARDSFTRFGGRLKSMTDFDMGISVAKQNTLDPHAVFHSGSVFLFKQQTTLFNRLTINTILQRGSPLWSTLDISNVYRNNFLYLQGISLAIVRGVNAYVNRSVTHSTDANRDQVTTIYNTGLNFSRGNNILPEISFNTNINQPTHQKTQYFNTLTYSWKFGLLRTRLNGQWLTSNNGPNDSTISTFNMRTRTVLYKGVSAGFLRQWSTPQTTNTNVSLDSGNLLSSRMRLSWSIGKIVSPIATQNTMTAGLSIQMPYQQRANVAFSRTAGNYQVVVTMNGAVGRERNLLTASTTPITPVIPTGNLTGRFYIDNDLSGTFDPTIDKPLPGLRVIASGSVARQLTDAEGRYVIRGQTRGFVSVRTDYNAIPANLAFMTPPVQDVFITPNRTKTIDFRFARFGRVKGTVVADSAVPANLLADIRVFVVGTDRDTLTNESGEWQIPDLTPGKYIAKIDPEYVSPLLEIVTGEIPVDIKPGGRLVAPAFAVKKRPVEFQEKRF
jgi:hypothetical protein